MCYRFNNTQEETAFRKQMKILGKVFKQESSNKRFSFYHTNGFAHELLPVVTQENSSEISFMHWGFVPPSVTSKADKDKYWKMGWTLNARSEEIFTTRSFKNAITNKRCLIPATGFYEWRELNGEKYPYLILVKSGEKFSEASPFCFAGVYNNWMDKETGEVIDSFAIITCEANNLLKKIHVNRKRTDQGGRMPVIVHPHEYDKWLNPITSAAELQQIMQPFPDEKMMAYTISKLITSRKENPNVPEVMVHYAYEELER